MRSRLLLVNDCLRMAQKAQKRANQLAFIVISAYRHSFPTFGSKQVRQFSMTLPATITANGAK
jgi:hypothetical protein